MASDQSPSAPNADEPDRPRRIRDGNTWVEPMVIRRNDDGTYARKQGNEPPACLTQLHLFGLDEAA